MQFNSGAFAMLLTLMSCMQLWPLFFILQNLYFPLLRHTPSREQRRLAMEKDMMNMQLSEVQKEYLRNRWRQNETEYLREQRRKVDVSAFVKLKTIGRGNFPSSSLFHFRV